MISAPGTAVQPVFQETHIGVNQIRGTRMSHGSFPNLDPCWVPQRSGSIPVAPRAYRHWVLTCSSSGRMAAACSCRQGPMCPHCCPRVSFPIKERLRFFLSVCRSSLCVVNTDSPVGCVPVSSPAQLLAFHSPHGVFHERFSITVIRRSDISLRLVLSLARLENPDPPVVMRIRSHHPIFRFRAIVLPELPCLCGVR